MGIQYLTGKLMHPGMLRLSAVAAALCCTQLVLAGESSTPASSSPEHTYKTEAGVAAEVVELPTENLHQKSSEKDAVKFSAVNELQSVPNRISLIDTALDLPLVKSKSPASTREKTTPSTEDSKTAADRIRAPRPLEYTLPPAQSPDVSLGLPEITQKNVSLAMPAS